MVSLKIMICSKRKTVKGFILGAGALALADDDESDPDVSDEKLSRQCSGPRWSSLPCAVILPWKRRWGEGVD